MAERRGGGIPQLKDNANSRTLAPTKWQPPCGWLEGFGPPTERRRYGWGEAGGPKSYAGTLAKPTVEAGYDPFRLFRFGAAVATNSPLGPPA
jgi:hypothetical protein